MTHNPRPRLYTDDIERRPKQPKPAIAHFEPVPERYVGKLREAGFAPIADAWYCGPVAGHMIGVGFGYRGGCYSVAVTGVDHAVHGHQPKRFATQDFGAAFAHAVGCVAYYRAALNALGA